MWTRELRDHSKARTPVVGGNNLDGRPDISETSSDADKQRSYKCSTERDTNNRIELMTMLRMLLLVSAAVLILAPAFACAPAPSCWIETGPAYLRSVCRGYAKDHQSLPQIAKYLDEPEKIQDFAKACKKLSINLSEK
jgi:hypothetical protein